MKLFYKEVSALREGAMAALPHALPHVELEDIFLLFRLQTDENEHQVTAGS